MSNLPSWPGASAAYSKAYRILQRLAAAGHATPPLLRRGKVIVGGHVSEDMRDAIDALNRGDENAIKAFNLAHLDLQKEAAK
jgi:hypothetical protein